MIEIAIVGAGLSGLALADRLVAEGREVRLFEARDRIGGRAQTVTDPETGSAVDLGPSWFWPESQPLMRDLVADLGLDSYPQHDHGAVLHLTDPEQGAEVGGTDPVHAGAHRIQGGVGAVVDGLAARLPAACIALGHRLEAVAQVGPTCTLQFATATGQVEVTALKVILALPPRLVAETVRFTPALPTGTRQALEDTETWMAGQAKAVMTYPRPVWRDAGQSGNAFVAHERAVLGEIFDLSGPDGTPGALGGFFALDPETRRTFGAGLPMLIGNQFAQLFGAATENGPLYVQDWAEEPLTASTLDRTIPSSGERYAARPLLRRAMWQGKLYFGGSETARAHPGHMEGALDAAQSLAERLLRTTDTLPTDLSGFTAWLPAQSEAIFAAYRTALTDRLSRQDVLDVTRMAAGDSIAALFEEALDRLAALEVAGADLAQAETRAALLDPMKPLIRDTLNRLIGQIMGFNRSSCALRAFPQEHHLPDPYIRAILTDVSTLGRGFFNEADAIFESKAEAA